MFIFYIFAQFITTTRELISATYFFFAFAVHIKENFCSSIKTQKKIYSHLSKGVYGEGIFWVDFKKDFFGNFFKNSFFLRGMQLTFINKKFSLPNQKNIYVYIVNASKSSDILYIRVVFDMFVVYLKTEKFRCWRTSLVVEIFWFVTFNLMIDLEN